MYVTQAVIDNIETFNGEKHLGDDIDPALITELVMALDGDKHTLLILAHDDGEAHMGIGGDAKIGLVVYETQDNMSFNNLLSDQPDNLEKVSMTAGGQPGDYERRYVVNAADVVTAACEYAESGTLAGSLVWEAK